MAPGVDREIPCHPLVREKVRPGTNVLIRTHPETGVGFDESRRRGLPTISAFSILGGLVTVARR
jgi:hypothetical protein